MSQSTNRPVGSFYSGRLGGVGECVVLLGVAVDSLGVGDQSLRLLEQVPLDGGELAGFAAVAVAPAVAAAGREDHGCGQGQRRTSYRQRCAPQGCLLRRSNEGSLGPAQGAATETR
jgi:hypothetical protein